MLNFFFIISHGKFARIDLANITHLIQEKDHTKIYTTTGIYTPSVSNRKIKELLPNDQLTWINKTTAVPCVNPNNNR